MSNVLIPKNGENVPNNNVLKEHEIGYVKGETKLYIGKSNGTDIEAKPLAPSQNEMDEAANSIESLKNDLKNLTLLMYPVGSVYFTTDTTFDPNETWGGTWENITGSYLYLDNVSVGESLGDSNNPFNINDHVLSTSNMPSHSHSISGTASATSAGTPSGSVSVSVGSHSHSYSGTIGSDGSHQHSGYYQTDGVASGSNRDRVVGSGWDVSNKSTFNYVTTSSGSHSHSYSGTTSSTTPTASASFSGSSMSTHSHSVSGSTDAVGNGAAITHVISNVNLPRYVVAGWHRTA